MPPPLNIINEYFDQVYVLNLERRLDRKAKMMHRLQRLGIEAAFVPAADGQLFRYQMEFQTYMISPPGSQGTHPLEGVLGRKTFENAGVWSLSMTYMRMLEDAQARGFRRILCLEDDAVFCHDFHAKLQRALSQIPQDWKLLYLGASQRNWQVPQGLAYLDESKSDFDPAEPFYLARKTNGSFAAGIDHSVFEPLMEEILKMDCPVDSGPMRAIGRTYPNQCLVLWPNLVIADVEDSDIRGKRDQQAISDILRWNLKDFDFPFQLYPGEKPEASGKWDTIEPQAPKRAAWSTGPDGKKIACIYHPWERLLACYLEKIHPLGYTKEGYKNGVASSLLRYGCFRAEMTFADFVDAVCGISDAVADPAFCSQLHQLMDEKGTFLADELIRQKPLLGPEVLKKYFTKELKEKVRKRYQLDISFLKYTFDGQHQDECIDLHEEAWQGPFFQSRVWQHLMKEQQRSWAQEIHRLRWK